MQITVELSPMFSYSFGIIIFVIIAIIVIFWMIKLYKKPKINETFIIPPSKNLIAIKNGYLQQLYNLEKDFNEKKISNRQAYQTLSMLIRNFIYEATNIKVQNYTLKEISTLNMPILYELVSEYYAPEFSTISQGNIASSINRTRVVIEKWN